jgi:hypothetical protein
VRKKAQSCLASGFYLFAYSYKSLLPEIVKYLRNDPEVEHHQFKVGLLKQNLSNTGIEVVEIPGFG